MKLAWNWSKGRSTAFHASTRKFSRRIFFHIWCLNGAFIFIWLINYSRACIDVFRVKMLSKQDQTGPFLSRKDNLLDLELLLGCRKWKEKLTVILVNSKNLLGFISAIMPLSMDLNLKRDSRTLTLTTNRYY